MADSTLEERLREHAESFDGLLSLIPAKHYYGEDNSDQWKKKKQTKQQAAAARRAKLDPDSDKLKSAKDIMDEGLRKRKLAEAELEADDESEMEGVEKEQPKQGLMVAQEKKQKKQKISTDLESKDDISSAEAKFAAAAEKQEKQRLKQERKKEKKAKKAEKVDQKKEKAKVSESKIAAEPVLNQANAEEAGDVDVEEAVDGEIVGFEAEGLEDKAETENASTSSSPGSQSPIFDSNSKPPSTTNTSTSSTIPPATAPKHIKLPTDPELLRARLAARIEALRAARKADGPDGTPARNRQELMESRRKKEEQRRAHKKELRMKAKMEEDEQREAALASARESPASSMMSPSVYSPPQNFSFGRVAFADGQQLGDDLTTTHAPKKKGPQDPATALQATENKRLRLAGLDEKKRADIEEKDLWLKAKKRAHGEKVRDDTSLLKKTLKRKEKMKKKSEKEWNERKEGVAKSQAMKQKKREENLQKRKDGKGTKGGKVKSKGGKPKVRSRPGFEGGGFGGSKKK
ncbi:hypothetical protein HYALB_00001283 [Hymenoscyphus albidus]|uniref:SURF6-domain-containing protein n=1 Tax=Hymenoscyphus albidus TaxID=595503 RepID=A0A9N9LIA7_9HELO|nr:hypothetical protein HYALB_00001283 [Hymenoscyphus albidus]